MKIASRLSRYVRSLQSLPRTLIGDVSFAWHPPQWLNAIGHQVTRKPLRFFGLILALIAIFSGLWMLRQAWAHRPVPLETDWIVSAPTPGEPSDDFQPQRLVVTFDRSIAKLETIGKPVKEGIVMTPPLAGTWTWTSDTELVFDPTEEWPAATAVRITLARSLFSPHARLVTLSKEFHTAPFTVTMNDLLFYINPKDPATKQITATLVFSHPVDRPTLEKNLQLTAQDEDQIFPGTPSPSARLTVTYAKRDRIAYVRSVNLHLPKDSGYARLLAPEAVGTKLGNANLASALESDVLVPSLYDLFRIESADAIIATDKNGEPSQALVLKTSVGVKSEVMAHAVHAYLLEHKAVKEDANRNPNLWTAAEVTPAILAKAKPVSLEPVANEEVYNSVHSFKLKVPENAEVYVTVDKGIQSLGSFPLKDAFASVRTVPPFQRQIRLLHDGSLLALNGERKLTVQSRGVEELEYRLARIASGEINHLVSQSEGSFQSPIFEHENFGESDLSELTVRRDEIVSTDAAESSYSAFDFSEFVKDSDANEGKLGLFILHILGRKPGEGGGYYQQNGDILADAKLADFHNNDGEISDPSENDAILSERRLILVTDLGLLVKDNADGTHDVFVQSIKTGEPVDGAKVQVLGKNGLPLVTAETDDQGRAPIPSLADFAREKRPVAYVVQEGRDVSFLPFGRQDRELNLSRFDTSGIETMAPTDLSAFVFTDRGIYRPGDEAKLGLIIKQHNWQGDLKNVPLELDVVDPRGTTVQTRVVKADASGLIEASFPTRETSATGEYQADCYLVKGKDDKTLIGSNSFKVREFLPDRLKIAAKLLVDAREGWVSQNGLKALVTLGNLYGTPSVGHRMKGKITLSPSSFHFERYPDFSFTDPYLDPNAHRKYQEEDLPEQQTDDAGETTFDLTTANIEPSAYQLSFLAEGFEKEGGRSVTAYAGILVSPSDWLLGTKPDGDFSYLARDSKRSVELLAVDPKLKSIAVEKLTLKLVERRYVSVLIQQPNGNYEYESVMKEIPVAEQTLGVPAGGLAWALDTKEPGDFAARFYNEQGSLMADVRYSVAGAGNLTRALAKNAELTAKLSKPEYLPGEEIEVQITAPYTGAGLITIERDKVYASQWFKAETTSSVQKIRIPKDFEGNGYINVAFVRALDSKEIYMSPLSYAVLPFKVNQEARHTLISIAAPKVVTPGKPLRWTIQANRPTRAVVYAVDEGILQVAGYHLPQPLAYFFRKEALGVGTRQTVDLILPEYSIAKLVAAAGGDGDQDLLSHHLNPFKRKHDKPVAFWSGIVDIGPQAKTFTYNVPDYFAGTIRVMVVAAAPDAVGSAETTTQVRGPFVISPNVPTFVAPGDSFDLSVTIANNIKGSGPNAPIDVTLTTTDGLEITQKPDGSVPIAEGRDASVHWLLHARDVLGNADITVTARSGHESSSLSSHLSIRPPVPYLTTLTSGYFKDAEQRVPVSRRLYPQFRSATATASILPQGFTRGLSTYLEHYEYGCTEQLISKAFPSLVSLQTMSQGQGEAEVARKLQDIYGVMASRQNDQGAFGLWQADPDLHFDLPSIWVVQFLTEAKERGYDVPDDMLTRGLAHLQQMAEENPNSFGQARNQAEAIYLLTRNGTVTTNFLERNRQWFETNAKDTWGEDVADVYLAASYALMKNQSQADDLIGRFHLVGAKMQAEDDFYNELGRDSQYVDILALHFPERLHRLGEQDLMALVRPIMDGEYNTISAAQAILALDTYARTVGKGNNALADLKIDEVIGQATKPLALSAGLYQEGTFDVDADALLFHKPDSNQLGLKGLFYQVAESGFDHEPVTVALSDGIEVSREYRDKDGHVTTTAKLGEELNVVVRVRGTGDQYIFNVAVLDLLPGGFEVVPESIQTGTCHFSGIDYADVREDRVLAFGDISNAVTEVTYRIKATNKGTYAVPPPQAEAMYHLKIRARGVTGQLTVTD